MLKTPHKKNRTKTDNNHNHERDDDAAAEPAGKTGRATGMKLLPFRTRREASRQALLRQPLLPRRPLRRWLGPDRLATHGQRHQAHTEF